MTFFHALCVLMALICLVLVARFRHNLANNRGTLLVMCLVACIPLVNIIIVCMVCYFVFFREAVINWLEKPFT